jgi:hypothetical protein
MKTERVLSIPVYQPGFFLLLRTAKPGKGEAVKKYRL